MNPGMDPEKSAPEDLVTPIPLPVDNSFLSGVSTGSVWMGSGSTVTDNPETLIGTTTVSDRRGQPSLGCSVKKLLNDPPGSHRGALKELINSEVRTIVRALLTRFVEQELRDCLPNIL